MAKKQSQAKKLSRHKFVGRNDRGARQRYWKYDVLKRHKVRNLVRCNGMTHDAAVQYWSSVRVRRIKKGV